MRCVIVCNYPIFNAQTTATQDSLTNNSFVVNREFMNIAKYQKYLCYCPVELQPLYSLVGYYTILLRRKSTATQPNKAQ